MQIQQRMLIVWVDLSLGKFSLRFCRLLGSAAMTRQDFVQGDRTKPEKKLFFFPQLKTNQCNRDFSSASGRPKLQLHFQVKFMVSVAFLHIFYQKVSIVTSYWHVNKNAFRPVKVIKYTKNVNLMPCLHFCVFCKRGT